MILREIIADDLGPQSKGGLTFYPASSLTQIFDWAEANGHALTSIEGVFYLPSTEEGQLSSSYTCIRGDTDHSGFRQACLGLAAPFEAEAAKLGMGAYFEIHVAR